MAQLSTKIELYVGRLVDFETEVILMDPGTDEILDQLQRYLRREPVTGGDNPDFVFDIDEATGDVSFETWSVTGVEEPLIQNLEDNYSAGPYIAEWNIQDKAEPTDEQLNEYEAAAQIIDDQRSVAGTPRPHIETVGLSRVIEINPTSPLDSIDIKHIFSPRLRINFDGVKISADQQRLLMLVSTDHGENWVETESYSSRVELLPIGAGSLTGARSQSEAHLSLIAATAATGNGSIANGEIGINGTFDITNLKYDDTAVTAPVLISGRLSYQQYNTSGAIHKTPVMAQFFGASESFSPVAANDAPPIYSQIVAVNAIRLKLNNGVDDAQFIGGRILISVF